MKIWFDITNTPHVHFFAPIINHYKKQNEVIVTARDYSETLDLLKYYNINYIKVGKHFGKNKFAKVIGLIIRTINLMRCLPEFDIGFGIGGQYTTPVCKLKRKPSITFTDNDTSFKWTSYKLGTYFIFPQYFDVENVVLKYGVNPSSIFTYNGFKEDIYMHDYKPDTDFLNKIPFKNFITIRPENLKANYVPSQTKSIVPDLFEKFKNKNILFLPRYDYEKKYALGYSNIYIPKKILNGKDVCYYSDIVLTGAGTLARESAILGTPAVSFFPGTKFLTVDRIMEERGLQFQSRDIDQIHNYVMANPKKNKNSLERSKMVYFELIEIINNILN